MKQNISNINKFIIAITFCGFGFNSMSQEGVAINTNGAAADNSAILDITSTEKGLLLPRLTNAQREAITSPANGLLIYNIETHCLNYYNGMQWREWCGDCVDEDLYPDDPGEITGNACFEDNETGVAYSISAVPDADSYSWTVPSGAMIASGQGTTSITVNFGTTAGNVCVVAINTCGTSNSSCKSVTSCQSNACPKGNYYWLFGQFVGLDFSTVPPTPYKDGSQNGQEGHASICDCSTGELLFNAFGTTLWDKNHTAITTTIVGASSTHTQCHFFTPKPGSSTLIYLFTRSNTAEGYRYTLIDRTLNGGLGDIVPGQQDIQIANFAGEKQCGIRHSNNKDVWMIIGKGTTGDIYAFLVSEDGVETTPVISSPGVGFSTYGQMKASPDGSRIALSAGGTKFILYNFNRSTGAVTNPITVNASSLYGIEFSPNGQVLYTSTLTDLYQYDITSGVPATIAASKVTIATANTGRSPQLGYDGKIYTCRGGAFIGVIENPDVFGAGCNYDPEGITLDPTTQTLYVIPNHIRGDD